MQEKINIFCDDCNKEFKMHQFLSKNKTFLNQFVPGDEYANIWSDVSCKARAWIVAFDKKKKRIPAAGAPTEVKWTSIKKLWETRNNLRIVAWNF